MFITINYNKVYNCEKKHYCNIRAKYNEGKNDFVLPRCRFSKTSKVDFACKDFFNNLPSRI